MGKKDSPVPQPVANIPAPPSLQSNITEFINQYPRLVELEKQYSPQLAQMDFDLLQQFSPQLTDFMAGEQQRLTPYTYGLQESLAKLASENINAGLPDALRNSYLDTLRSEIGPNAGSGIGADYVSTNLLRLGEDYKGYYHNLALSLLNRLPISQPSTPGFRNPAGNFGLADSMNYNAGTFGAYSNALAQQDFWVPQRSGGMNSILGGAAMGGLGGLAIGAAAGPYGMVGAGLGALGGGLLGGF